MKIKFSTPITSCEVCFATGAKYRGEKRIFTHLSTSSCDTNEETLFFALQGTKTSGEEFVRELEKRNICSVSSREGKCLFTHSSPLSALLCLASYYKGKLCSLKKTIAITGSVGKTTTKEYLLRILSTRWKTYANEGNFNSEIGVPMSILTTPIDTEMLILEFGMNHRGEMARLAECARPDFAIITSIGHAHIGNLGSREAIAEEKMKISANNPEIPILTDAREPLLEPLKKKITLYGDLKINEMENNTTEFHYHNKRYALSFPRLWEDTRSCMYFATSAGILMGLDEKELQRGVNVCASAPQRRKEITLGGFRLIDDTYNASPEAMISALSYLREINAKRKFVVLGDMQELGEFTESLHHTLGERLTECSPEAVYLFGEYGCYTREGLMERGYPTERVHCLTDTKNHEGLIRMLSDVLKEGDVCLLKGSHASKLWRVSEGLMEVFLS